MDKIPVLSFFFENINWILFVVLFFSFLAIYMIVNNIKFKEKKSKVVRVVTIEKMTNKKPTHTKEQLKSDMKSDMKGSDTCHKLTNKVSCTSLGTCVWATAKDNGKKIDKCITAQALGKDSKAAQGSDGPQDLCYKTKNGKLVPWDEYYYLDGKNIKSKKGKQVCG